MFVESIEREKILGEITQKLEKIVSALQRGNSPDINESMALHLLDVSDEIANFGERFGREDGDFIQMTWIIKGIGEKLLNRGTFVLERKGLMK